jgi:hypothetical protein
MPQYIQWVQQQKLKLVSKIVDTESVTQAEIDTERWKVCIANGSNGCKTNLHSNYGKPLAALRDGCRMKGDSLSSA